MSEDETPMGAAQRLARPALPRRFYERVSVEPQEGGFGVLLDGRTVKTPAKKPLVVPRRDIAEAMAAEWEAQGEEIDPATMPLTRLVNSAIDRVSVEMAAVRDDIVRHAGSDLICYRAEGPEPLVEVEQRLWDPILAAAERALGGRFLLAGGIVHVGQEPRALAAVGDVLSRSDPLSLAAIHSMTTLTGSALIALAVARGELSPADAWTAAHADEDWQMSQWGADELALEARANRWRDMQAAATLVIGAGAGSCKERG